MSNVYEKLQQARIELQEMNLKKSGRNTFAKYDYFELQDFIPQINQLFAKVKLFSMVNFTPETATLTIINTEKSDETIEFTSPMAEANLKGTHQIQNAGAVMTYQRRYLYVTALEIVEHDALDPAPSEASPPARIEKTEPTEKEGQAVKMITDKQLKMIQAKLAGLATKNNTTKEAILKKMNIEKPEELTFKNASKTIDFLISQEKK